LSFCVVDSTGHSPTREGREWWYFMQFMLRLQYKLCFYNKEIFVFVDNNCHCGQPKILKWDIENSTPRVL
jgi:hypothetical protein